RLFAFRFFSGSFAVCFPSLRVSMPWGIRNAARHPGGNSTANQPKIRVRSLCSQDGKSLVLHAGTSWVAVTPVPQPDLSPCHSGRCKARLRPGNLDESSSDEMPLQTSDTLVTSIMGNRVTKF